jgi:diaminopropionate ammonia-lyase
LDNIKEAKNKIWVNEKFLAANYSAPQRLLMNDNSFKRAYHSINSIQQYEETPLINLDKTAYSLNIKNLWCKFEGTRFGGGSFKTLGISYALLEILRREIGMQAGRSVSIEDLIARRFADLQSRVTFSAPTSGNHGYALAWTARLAGTNCNIYLPSDVTAFRRNRIEDLGATVVVVRGTYNDAITRCSTDSIKFGHIVVSNLVQKKYEDIPTLIMNGYSIIAHEIFKQLPDQPPTHIFVGGGGGRLAAAICGYYWMRNGTNRPRIVVVEPNDSDCLFQSTLHGKISDASTNKNSVMTGLVVRSPSQVAWTILKDGVFANLTISDREAVWALRELAEGINGDPSIAIGETGISGIAGFLAVAQVNSLRDRLEINSDSEIITIACEGLTDPQLVKHLISEWTEA